MCKIIVQRRNQSYLFSSGKVGVNTNRKTARHTYLIHVTVWGSSEQIAGKVDEKEKTHRQEILLNNRTK